MASKWISTFKGRRLPKGLRAKRTQAGDRIYIRLMVDGSKQLDLPTNYFLGEPGAVTAAHSEYLRRKLERDLSRREPTASPTSNVAQASVRAVLTAEYAHFESRGTRTPQDLQNFRKVAEFWETHLGGPDFNLHQLTQAHVRAYILTRRREVIRAGRPPSFGSIFRELRVLGGAIKRAKLNRQMDPSFTIQWPKITEFKADPVDPEKKVWARSQEELAPFLAALPEAVRDLFLFSMHTGLRAGELMRLRGRDFERVPRTGGRPTVTVKTKERRPGPFVCQLSQTCVEIIERALFRNDGDMDALLFDLPGNNGRKRTVDYSYKADVRAVNDKLGLKGRDRIKLRDMRATFGRAVYDAKGPNAARKALRHKSLEMTVRYLDLSDESIDQVDADTLFGAKLGPAIPNKTKKRTKSRS